MPRRRSLLKGWAFALAGMVLLAAPGARAQAPIKIGFGMALTGGLAANGKAALLAYQIWAEDTNAKGGLLGRKVELVFYDDQSNPSTVPGIYTKLLDVDKVDLVVSGYATNMVAPAMPIVMSRNMTFMGLFALAVNEEFKYDRYFGSTSGPEPKREFSRGFFDVALKQNPKPQTVALVGADAEFGKNAIEGARDNLKGTGIKIVYDRSYPPATVDFSPIVRAIQATNPDIVFIASYPPDTAGMIRAAHEVGLKTKLIGGGMIGPQAAALKTQLGPLLNGIVTYDMYVPEPTMKFPRLDALLEKYQARAPQAGTDPLGFYIPPVAYANLEILGAAVTATGGLDQGKIAAHIHATTFDTVLGPFAFGREGNTTEPHTITVQYQNIQGNDLAQFKKAGTQVIVAPDSRRSGDLVYPWK